MVAAASKLEENLDDFWTWVNVVWTTAKGTKLSWDNRHYLIDIYKDQHPSIVWTKSAQMGLTERELAEAVWLADRKGVNVLYCFPAAQQLNDLVQARLDPILMKSPYFRKRTGLDKEKGDGTKSVAKLGLKRIGKGHIYFRGSTNESQIITIDADCCVLDERDRFAPKSVPFIDKRTLASDLGWRREISTPTRPGIGVDAAYKNSDRRVWEIKCKSCGKWQELDFFKNIDFKNKRLLCQKCKKVMKNRTGPGRWRATNPSNKEVHGYKINGLYNPKRDIPYYVDKYRQARQKGYFDLQQFFNQDLGLPYEVGGQSIDTNEITACISGYKLPLQVSNNTFVGADVGSDGNHHVAVVQQLSDKDYRIVWIGVVSKFMGPYDSIESIINIYKPTRVVIDKRPEVSRVKELMQSFPEGIVYAAEYPSMKFPVGENAIWDDVKREVKLDRTVSIDYVVSDIKNKRLQLPENIKSVEGFYDQLKSISRITEKNPRTGVDTARWVEKGADHYVHALVYATAAKSRGMLGKALLSYYTEEPTQDLLNAPLTGSFIDWVRINGQRIKN